MINPAKYLWDLFFLFIFANGSFLTNEEFTLLLITKKQLRL